MNTRIKMTLIQWFPDAFNDLKKPELKSDYEVLHHFAQWSKKMINSDNENKREPFKVINLLYSKGTLFEKNAIENEFFKVLAFEENPNTIKEHMDLMPEVLKSIYLKTILEN